VPLAVVDWTQVLVALIAGLPAILAAVVSLRVRRDIQTPSGRSIGKQVEDNRHVGLSNAYRLESLRKHAGAEQPFEHAADAPSPDEPTD
jgi:hypothetical protein